MIKLRKIQWHAPIRTLSCSKLRALDVTLNTKTLLSTPSSRQSKNFPRAGIQRRNVVWAIEKDAGPAMSNKQFKPVKGERLKIMGML